MTRRPARLGDAFARDWSIMGLVEAITAEPAFTSDAAVRSKVRTPVEKLVGIAQAGGATTIQLGTVRKRAQAQVAVAALARRCGAWGSSRSCRPTSVASRRARCCSARISSCTRSISSTCSPGAPAPAADVDALLAQFGFFDVARTTRDVLEREKDDGRRFALAAMSPEFSVT